MTPGKSGLNAIPKRLCRGALSRAVSLYSRSFSPDMRCCHNRMYRLLVSLLTDVYMLCLPITILYYCFSRFPYFLVFLALLDMCWDMSDDACARGLFLYQEQRQGRGVITFIIRIRLHVYTTYLFIFFRISVDNPY